MHRSLGCSCIDKTGPISSQGHGVGSEAEEESEYRVPLIAPGQAGDIETAIPHGHRNVEACLSPQQNSISIS